MKTLHFLGLSATGLLCLVGAVVLLRPKPVVPKHLVVKPAAPVTLPATVEGLRSYVQAHGSAADPKEQDLVGQAKIRIAYASAAKKDWTSARAQLLDVAKEYKGTNSMSSDFGGVPDQARYQAAACLVGAGKTKEAEAEFVRFMREEPMSPLVYAARKRLMRLNGGQAKPEWDELLQEDISKQEKRARLEMSMCGPKCIERLLKEAATLGLAPQKTNLDYKEIAKLCGTTGDGTTIEQMRAGLKKLGCRTYAYMLNRDDIMRAPMPAILEEGAHYLLIEKASLGKATYFDPLMNQSTTAPISKDEGFQAPVILFSPADIANE